MSNIIKSQAGYQLAAGVNQATINSELSTFGISLSKMWDKLTTMAALTMLQYVEQKHVAEMGKGDTSSIKLLGELLFDNNTSMFKAYNQALNECVGLKLTAKDGEGIDIVVDLTNMKRDNMLGNFQGKFENFYEKGIKALYQPQKRSSKGGKGKGKGEESSAAVDVTVAATLLEDSGFTAAISTDSEAERERLAELLPLLTELAKHVKSNPNKSLVKDQLTSALGKLNKGFTLAGVMSDKVAI